MATQPCPIHAFHDEMAARKHLEALRWPSGPVCAALWGY